MCICLSVSICVVCCWKFPLRSFPFCPWGIPAETTPSEGHLRASLCIHPHTLAQRCQNRKPSPHLLPKRLPRGTEALAMFDDWCDELAEIFYPHCLNWISGSSQIYENIIEVTLLVRLTYDEVAGHHGNSLWRDESKWERGRGGERLAHLVRKGSSALTCADWHKGMSVCCVYVCVCDYL